MTMNRTIFLHVAAASLLSGAACAQDSPSLGDLARQQRQQKAQSKAAPGKEAKAPKVITNEGLITHTGSSPAPTAPSPAPAASGEKSAAAAPASVDGAKQSTEEVSAQIKAQKDQLASLKAQMEELNESIQFAPGNCVSNCVQWNERQKEKQQQVERMQEQLEELKKHLDEMQESARKQGFGSSIYDP